MIAAICFIAAGIMYYVGNDSSHLSELADFFYIPIPLGIIALIVGSQK
jgi:hypothetical protein